MERDQYWSDRDWCAWLESVFACLVVFLPTGFPVALYHLLDTTGRSEKSQGQNT